MKPKITIASTSFVLPKNSAWRALDAFGDLTFADYGDYAGSFMRAAPDETLVFIVFVQISPRSRPTGSSSAARSPAALAHRAARRGGARAHDRRNHLLVAAQRREHGEER